VLTTVKIPILSFFSGGGFLDVGFEMAGFETVFSNEIDKDFAQFYKEGMSSWSGKKKEISSIGSIEDISSNYLKPNINHSIFGIVGGPPCQDFSMRGSRIGFEGIRGTSTFHFYEKIIDLTPSFFLMENVPGLIRLNKTKAAFLDLLTLLEEEYLITQVRLNSLHYGVPQSRERLFVFGIQKHLNEKVEALSNSKEWFTWPTPSYPEAESVYRWGEPSFKAKTEKYLSLPHPPPELCVGSILLKDNAITNNLPNASEQFRLKKLEKIREIEEGDTYRQSFKRLHRNKFSPTACYGNNEVHLHPYVNRRLTIREALRIQGVPDNYILTTKGKLSKKFKMIGNGVPVPLAYSVAVSIRSFIESVFENSVKTYGYMVKGKTKLCNVKNTV
jgi:DNA (cytosine-5)-methyltransferase 1